MFHTLFWRTRLKIQERTVPCLHAIHLNFFKVQPHHIESTNYLPRAPPDSSLLSLAVDNPSIVYEISWTISALTARQKAQWRLLQSKRVSGESLKVMRKQARSLSWASLREWIRWITLKLRWSYKRLLRRGGRPRRSSMIPSRWLCFLPLESIRSRTTKCDHCMVRIMDTLVYLRTAYLAWLASEFNVLSAGDRTFINKPNRIFQKTTEYLEHFARFKTTQAAEAIGQLLAAHKELEKFERAQLGTFSSYILLCSIASFSELLSLSLPLFHIFHSFCFQTNLFN